MTASIVDISNRALPTPILSGSRDTLCFSVYQGDKTPETLAGQYAQLAYKTLGEFPVMLRHFDFARILSDDNLVIFVLDGEQLLSAGYAVRQLQDYRPLLLHKGYVSRGRGLAKVMAAGLHVAEYNQTGEWADGEAVARILRSGEINEASSSPFADVGFHGVRNIWAKVGRGDIHLAPFSVRHPNGLWIGSHVMAGRAEKIADRAGDILRYWTLT